MNGNHKQNKSIKIKYLYQKRKTFMKIKTTHMRLCQKQWERVL
jgi:hypothetical protein